MSLWVKQNNRCPLCQQEWVVQRIGKWYKLIFSWVNNSKKKKKKPSHHCLSKCQDNTAWLIMDKIYLFIANIFFHCAVIINTPQNKHFILCVVHSLERQTLFSWMYLFIFFSFYNVYGKVSLKKKDIRILIYYSIIFYYISPNQFEKSLIYVDITNCYKLHGI